MEEKVKKFLEPKKFIVTKGMGGYHITYAHLVELLKEFGNSITSTPITDEEINKIFLKANLGGGFTNFIKWYKEEIT